MKSLLPIIRWISRASNEKIFFVRFLLVIIAPWLIAFALSMLFKSSWKGIIVWIFSLLWMIILQWTQKIHSKMVKEQEQNRIRDGMRSRVIQRASMQLREATRGFVFDEHVPIKNCDDPVETLLQQKIKMTFLVGLIFGLFSGAALGMYACISTYLSGLNNLDKAKRYLEQATDLFNQTKIKVTKVVDYHRVKESNYRARWDFCKNHIANIMGHIERVHPETIPIFDKYRKSLKQKDF